MEEKKTRQDEPKKPETPEKRRYVKPAVEAEEKVYQYSLGEWCNEKCTTGLGYR